MDYYAEKNEWIAKGEEIAEKVLRKSKHILPHLGRLCLVSTFIEDGLRMFHQWDEQRDYLRHEWGINQFTASVLILYNLFAQLIGSGMAVVQFKSTIACAILFSVVVLQTILYNIFSDYNFFARNLALCGSLLLLLVKQDDNKRLLAGLPSLGNDNYKKYTQLIARLLLVVMFFTLLRFELTVLNTIQLVFGGVLILFVTIGFKTKLSALILVIYLLLINFTMYRFWTANSHSHEYDFLKYDFFQTLSVIGGLFLIVALGAGGVSVDERHKKAW